MEWGTFVATQLLLGASAEDAMALVPANARAEVSQALSLGGERNERARALANEAARVMRELSSLEATLPEEPRL